jgi:hypothetical protein
MGYDLHITRAEFWAENDAEPIAEDEWLRLVDDDPQLRPDPKNVGYTLWLGPSTHEDPWFHWSRGNISTKNPDRPIVAKMLEIANRLEARVQGDDGESYEDASDFSDD